MLEVSMPETPMISIVDDDPWARDGIKDFVLSLGYRAQTFTSAEDFIESGRVEDTSCLITDLRMPGMGGFGLQDHLRAQGHRTPIIVITAHPDEKNRSRALKAGAACFLGKPFDEQVLIDTLARVAAA
jgi:FixJ family two-component response regulator